MSGRRVGSKEEIGEGDQGSQPGGNHWWKSVLIEFCATAGMRVLIVGAVGRVGEVWEPG